MEKEIRSKEEVRFVKDYYFDVYSAKSLENICHLEEPYIKARHGYKNDANCEEIIKKENIAAYYFGIAKKFNISRENPDGVKS